MSVDELAVMDGGNCLLQTRGVRPFLSRQYDITRHPNYQMCIRDRPPYLMDHSGLAMQTTSFNDPWDSGQVGWIYVSKEDALKEFGGEKMTGALRKKAEDLMRSEVAAYDSYLRGECYGFEPVSYTHLDVYKRQTGV